MIVYIKDFKFKKFLGKPKLSFKYFTGYTWKHISADNNFNNENIAVYTRYVFDCVIKDLCGPETDVFKRDNILKNYESVVKCIEQLNSQELSGATKLFS